MKRILFFWVLAFLSSVLGQTCPRCTPLCQNGDGTPKLCGNDGCGGSCGTCPLGQDCCRGVCICSANCAGRACGDDGCGGDSCGQCSPTQTCQNGQCIGTATPDCSGRQCGSNRAGGTCGSCQPGQRCRVGQCECYYDCNDRNCGNAIQPPGANTGLCPTRTCGTCPTGFTCGTNGSCSAQTPCTVTVTVVDCTTRHGLAVPSSVLITSVTLSYTSTITVSAGVGSSWNTPGLGSFTFQTTAQGYLTNNQTFTLTSATTSVELCVNPATLQIDVRSNVTNLSIEVPATITYTGASSGSWRWTGITTFTYTAYGSYTFTATPDSKYTNGTTTVTVNSSTTIVIIYVTIKEFCGDGSCNNQETWTTCQKDCAAVFFEFENADGSGPVNGAKMNYFVVNPLDFSNATGPVRNSVIPTTTRTTPSGSSTVLEETYSYGVTIWTETVVSGFLNFYWRANTSNVDPSTGTYRLRAHLSRFLTGADFNYRFVNTWKPIDVTPTPYGPTDLNLHSFHPSGPLDVNNPKLLASGFQIGKSVADSKQSGGPATMDISPNTGEMVAIWNSKPPRSAVIAPSQNGRYLVDSGSYIVFYGKTVDTATTGKQLGVVVLDEIFLTNPAEKNDHLSDLWYIAQFTVNQPAGNMPTIVPQFRFKQSTIDSSKNMFFNCEAYNYCSNFQVPYSDTGR